MIRQHGRLLAYTCGVPAIAWIVLSLVQMHQGTDWLAAVKKDFPLLSSQELEARSLPRLCAPHPPPREIAKICGPYNTVASLRELSMTTIVATLLLLLAIHWIGQRCRRNRELLLTWFRISSIATTIATLVLAQAVLLSATFYYGPAEFLNRILSGLIFLTILGALIAVYQVVRLLFDFNKEVPLEVEGRVLPEPNAPDLWNFVREIAGVIGTEPPQNIAVGITPTFFVTETKVSNGASVAKGRTLYVSLPLCRILTRTELRSIIGHEMAHFHGEDTAFSQRFYPMFRSGASALEAIYGTAQSVGGGGYALLPAVSLLSFHLNSFSAAEAEISREREIAADAIGAKITTPHDIAVALTKIVQFDPIWEQVYTDLLNSPSAEKSDLHLPSESFIELAKQQFRNTDRAEQIAKLENEKLQHPTDSHPPLGDRLKALGTSVAEVYDAAGAIHPDNTSYALIPNAEALERELIPAFAPKSEEIDAIFQHRQAGFAAMEYHTLFLNRSFLIYVANDGLYGLKFRGLVGNEGRFFDPVISLLDNPYLFPGTEEFRKLMKEWRGSFILPLRDITDATFDSSRKWGMGNVPHTGKLKIRFRNGRRRTFVLLGEVYGDGISRYISERAAASRLPASS